MLKDVAESVVEFEGDRWHQILSVIRPEYETPRPKRLLDIEFISSHRARLAGLQDEYVKGDHMAIRVNLVYVEVLFEPAKVH